jgi:hypothetical protein
MIQNRDEFPKGIREALAKRAAYICSNPDCHTLTIAPSDADESKFLYFGKAAHICAAGSGGPRFKPEPEMTPEQRMSAANGIFLCSNCAAMIDNNKGLDFTDVLLQSWKVDHDKWVKSNLNKKQGAPQQQVTTYVKSEDQQGGITAGVVNIHHVRSNKS